MGLNRHFDFALPALFRLRTFARRFISALRCSGLSSSQKMRTAFFACSVRSFLVVPFQRLRPVHRRIAEVLPGADAKPPFPAVARQLKKVVEEAAKEEAAASPR